MPAPNYRQLARDFASAVGLNPDIYERQINQESGFNPSVKSGAGAIGIAQIMPATARSWGVDPTDPVASLKVAAKQMANYVKTYKAQGNDDNTAYKLALAAYNGGTGGANYLKKTNFAIEPNKPSYAWGNQTARYVQNIMGGTKMPPQQPMPNVGLTQHKLPNLPPVNVSQMQGQLKQQEAQLNKQIQSLRQGFSQKQSILNQPKSNPFGAFTGGVLQGATAFAARPQIAPQDAGWQTAGNLLGSLAPIGIGAFTGGPLGAAAGAGAVAAGADIYRQDMEAAAGLRKNFNFASPLIQGGLGAALAPIPFAAKGMGLLPRAALGAGVGAVTGAAGPAVEMATDPMGATTGADVARAALMGAGIGSLGAAAFVPGKPALNRALSVVNDPIPSAVSLPGRKFLSLPSVSSSTPPLRLPGGVEVPTAGPRGGVMLKENPLRLPEISVQEGPTLAPRDVVQGEVIPPDVPMVQPEPVPIPEVIQRAVSDASQFGEYPVYMTKGAANTALKSTEVPSTIVQDGKRYRVLPKGSTIPEYTSIFERGQLIDFNGESARVIGEPFGQVELRLSDGSIRLVPRETVLDYISKTSYAGGANDTAKVLSKAQKIETERRQVSTILSELTQTETDSIIANEFFQNRDLRPKNEPDITTGGKNWQSIKLGGKKLIYQSDDPLVKALDRFRAQGLEDPTSALERVVMRTGGLDSLMDEAQLIRKKITTGESVASSEDIFSLQDNQLKQELHTRDAIENAAFDNAAKEADNILRQLDTVKTMEEWDTLANRVDDIVKMTPEDVVAKLETKLNESLAKVFQQEPATPEPPVIKDLTQPEVPTQPAGKPTIQERLNTYFKESGFTGLDEAKIAKSLQQFRKFNQAELDASLKRLGVPDIDTANQYRKVFSRLRSEDSIIAKGKELGLTPEQALAIKQSLVDNKDAFGQIEAYQNLRNRIQEAGGNPDDAARYFDAIKNTDENILSLLKEDFDPETGIGQQRYARDVQLSDETLKELVAQLTPEQKKIAQIMERAMQEDKPVRELYQREGTGATSGEAGEYSTVTPYGFEKRGDKLGVNVYNEEGNPRFRVINSTDPKASGFTGMPEIAKDAEPYRGPYANIYKPLGKFDVGSILDRLPAEAPIKTSELQKWLTFADNLMKSDASPAMKRVTEGLLKDPRPRTYRRWMAEMDRLGEPTIRKYIKELEGRC